MGHNLEQCSHCDADKSEDMPCSNCGQIPYNDEYRPTREKSNDAFDEVTRRGLRSIIKWCEGRIEGDDLNTNMTLISLSRKVERIQTQAARAWSDNL